jgi:hypothetical protein
MQTTFNVTETIQDIHEWNTVIRSKRAPTWRPCEDRTATRTWHSTCSDQQRSYTPTTWWYCRGCQFAPNLCHWGCPIHVVTPHSFPDFRTEQLTFVILIQKCMKVTIEDTYVVCRVGLRLKYYTHDTQVPYRDDNLRTRESVRKRKKEKKKRLWKPSKCNCVVDMRLWSRWFPTPTVDF